MGYLKKVDRLKKVKIRSIFGTLDPLATIQLIYLGSTDLFRIMYVAYFTDMLHLYEIRYSYI